MEPQQQPKKQLYCPSFVRNSDGSVSVLAMLSVPSNDSELQLFRVLQRANLLYYYDTFIQNGGDDVQQLYDAYRQQSSTQLSQANERENMNEFIEIMKMVGMTKILHIRRLQKALIEWGSNPAEFQKPLIQRELTPNPQQMNLPALPAPILPQYNPLNNANNLLQNSNPQLHQPILHNIIPQSTPQTSIASKCLNTPSVSLSQLPSISQANLNSTIVPTTIQPNLTMNPNSMNSKINQTIMNSLISPINQINNSASLANTSSTSLSSSINSSINLCKSPTASKNDSFKIQNTIQNNNLLQSMSQTILPGNLNLLNSTGNLTFTANLNANNLRTVCCTQTNGNYQNKILDHSNSPICMTNVLKDNEIQSLKEAAIKILEMYDRNGCKLVVSTKKMDDKTKAKKYKILQRIINMDKDDPNRINEIRKYASIYGRFDCKRNPDKPLSMHEIFVNEACVQLCSLRIKLLLDRQILFSLARKTVNLAGYQYSKGHSRSQSNWIETNSESSSQPETINENNSIDVEREDSDSNDTSTSKNENQQHFASLKEQTVKLMNLVGDQETAANDYLLREEKLKYLKDQLEVIDKEIESIIKINELRSEESNELDVSKLDENQKLLIERRNDLVKQISILDSNSITNSPKGENSIYNSDTDDDDTNSQLSINSKSSSKDGNQIILENSLVKFNSSTHLDNSNNLTEFNRTTLKRKLLESTQSKTKKTHPTELQFKSSSKENSLSNLSDEDKAAQEENGMDLRISYFNQKKDRKK